MAELLRDDGYEISVVTPKIYKGSQYFEEQNGIMVYRFPFLARNKLLIEYKKIPYLRMVLYYITGFFLTIYAVFKNRCDVIHTHWAIPTGLIGVWVGTLLRKPLAVTIHGSDLRMALESSKFVGRLFIYVCKKADHLNCVSEVQKKELERLGVPSEKISTIPMGIDAAFLDTGKNRAVESRNRPIKILSNRNLLPIYNISLLIRAIPIVLKEAPETKFLIAGDGTERKSLERDVESLNINSSVKFLGRVPHEEMPNLLSQADIYVSTSLHDGTSVSLLEAMGSGAFPIVTDIPANREWIITGQNGFLVPVDEERCLANRIINAIQDQVLVRESRTKNFSIVRERVVWPVNIGRIENIYSNLLRS